MCIGSSSDRKGFNLRQKMFACDIYWATADALQAPHDALLDESERGRRDRYLREEDRTRFTLGAVLLRLVVGPGQPIDRTCERCGEPHGRPRLPGDDRHVSVTHSGAIAAVAITRAGPVGIDVETLRVFDHTPLLADVLAPEERAPGLEAFFAYWTRKESVHEVAVSAPHEPAQLLRYQGEALDARMTDLALAPGHAGAATVLTARPVRFRVHRDRLEA
jgi:4'-phosphopantetheinyl transferase